MISPLSDFVQRRAPRTVRPYRANVRPSIDLEAVLQRAYDIGLCAGIANRQYEVRVFETGAEWIAWLRGWRAGRERFKAEQACQAQAEWRRQAAIDAALAEWRPE